MLASMRYAVFTYLGQREREKQSSTATRATKAVPSDVALVPILRRASGSSQTFGLLGQDGMGSGRTVAPCCAMPWCEWITFIIIHGGLAPLVDNENAVRMTTDQDCRAGSTLGH
jgi:hypothetical protein